MTARAVVVADYGRGNLFSVCQAVARVGGAPVLSSDPVAVRGAERVILPGVGAFGDAMAGLRARGLDEALVRFAATGRPLLGVCLGMQLLLEESSEFGRHGGLGLLPGRVERLPQPAPGSREKVPNVGWCRLEPVPGGTPWADSLLAAVKPGDFAYFVHSYAAQPGVPRLGVCLGMQSMAAAFGGSIVRAPTLVHGEASEVTHDGAGLLAGMPPAFMAARYHSLAVDPATLPAELRVTAMSEVDRVIMGIRHVALPLEGVQFHPESVLTPQGPHLLANFLRLAGEGEAARLDAVSGTFATSGMAEGAAAPASEAPSEVAPR